MRAAITKHVHMKATSQIIQNKLIVRHKGMQYIHIQYISCAKPRMLTPITHMLHFWALTSKTLFNEKAFKYQVGLEIQLHFISTNENALFLI